MEHQLTNETPRNAGIDFAINALKSADCSSQENTPLGIHLIREYVQRLERAISNPESMLQSRLPGFQLVEQPATAKATTEDSVVLDTILRSLGAHAKLGTGEEISLDSYTMSYIFARAEEARYNLASGTSNLSPKVVDKISQGIAVHPLNQFDGASDNLIFAPTSHPKTVITIIRNPHSESLRVELCFKE